ncbi:MAG: hypothetical protein ACYCPQ_00445 [Elusimicrobiota bacterium]
MAGLDPTPPSAPANAPSGALDSCRYLLDPEAMTAEERLDRIVELLAVASVRLAQTERETASLPDGERP